MSVLGDLIKELKIELLKALKDGNTAKANEIKAKIGEAEKELKKQQENIEKYGTITPVNMPKHINVSAIPQEQEKADRKAVRELFWGSNQLDSEVPEKKKSFIR